MASSIALLFRSTDEQITPVQAKVTGTIPDWLDGNFLRIGPGLFEIEDFTVNHWFDGFAVLYKFEISKGKITFMKRYLQSDAYKKALIAKRPVYTEFGTKAYTDVTKNIFSRVISNISPDLTDNCTINVFTLNGQVYASSESANIRQIDLKTLSTLEKINLSSVGATLISSHFQTDSSGDTYTMATEIFTSAHYTVVKVPASDNKNPFKKVSALCTFSPQNKGPSTYHSFGTTDNYIIFIEQPLTLNMLKVMTFQVKGRSLYECTEWKPHLLNIFHIIDKRTGKLLPTKYLSTSPFFLCHFINCYEEDSQLVVDVVEYDSPKLFDQMYLNVVRHDKFDLTDGGCARRFVVPILHPDEQVPEEDKNLVTLKTTATAIRKGDTIHLSGQTFTERGYEQPCINRKHQGRKYRYFYASGMVDCGELRNTIVKMDMETENMLKWKESDTSFPGEPHFVPNPTAQREDDGLLLVPITDTNPAKEDCLVFLDGTTLREVARASVSCHVPNLMHGLFISSKK